MRLDARPPCAYSYYAPQIHSLAGSASNSTLVIANGLRLPGGGEQGYVETDPNIIPTIAIQRVEVLADGASSIYGSDAVAGVVNFITRKDFEGLEIHAQSGFADSYGNNNLGLLWGTRWSTGSVMVAGGYNFQSRLAYSSRSFLSMGDYTPVGGNKFAETFGCPVAAVSVPGSSNLYVTPQSTQAVANSLANRNCNTTVYGDDLPQSIRENALVQVNQNFGDRLTASFMLDVNDLKTVRRAGPGSVSNVTVYGPGNSHTSQINPFFQAPAGAPTANQESVTWVDLMGNGPNGMNFGTNTTEEDTIYSQFVVAYKFPGSWEAKLSDSLGYNINNSGSINNFCSVCAMLELNGTAQSSASTTATDISALNVVSLNLPLTTANALDVWNPAASNKTSAAALRNLYRGEVDRNDYDAHNQLKLEGDGSLFDLPAGPLKLAIGTELAFYHLIHESAASDGIGPLFLGQQALFFHYTRVVYSGYAELHIPITSPDMNIPLLRKLEVDISGRYDKYSDVGPSANPKYAMNWQLFDGLQLRANYSTSFVAPPMGVIGDPNYGGEYSSGASVTNGGLVVPVGPYPNVVLLPGCGNATASCTLPSSDQGLNRQFGGGINNMKPQTGNGWSIGADLAPDFLPGFLANITLFNNKFKGGVNNAGSFALVTSTPALQKNFTIYPGCATQQQIDSFTRVPQGAIFNGTIPSCVLFTWNHDETNVLNLSVQGIDAQASYQFDTDWGQFRIGDNLTEFLNFRQNAANGPWFSILNTSGLNITFPSVQTQMRGNLGWTGGPLQADLFVNFTGSYRYIGSTAVNPLIYDVNGNYKSGGDMVKPNTTIDLHVSYTFEDGLLADDQIYVDGKNIFDKNPPFMNGNTSGIGIGANGFNEFVSNPIGRIISLGLMAKF